jgi:hypothetical protein
VELNRLRPIFTVAVILAFVVAIYMGQLTYYRVWGAGVALAGAHTAWKGSTTYGIRGGPTLGEVKGSWVRVLAAIIFVCGILLVVHPQFGCALSRHPACT